MKKRSKNGANRYDYGARMYSAELGRWHAVDNYATDYHMMSPYTGIGNNPINYYDPDGNRMHEYTMRPDKSDSRYSENRGGGGGGGGGSWSMIDSNGSPIWRASDGIFGGISGNVIKLILFDNQHVAA